MSPKTLNKLGNFALPVPRRFSGKYLTLGLRYFHTLIDSIGYPMYDLVFIKVFAITWLNETTEVVKHHHAEHRDSF